MMEDNDWMVEEENHDIEFSHLKRNLSKSGYRDGVTDGHEYILQKAFNEGFDTAKLFYRKLSKYRGILSALLMYMQYHGIHSSDVFEKLEKTIELFESYEEDRNDYFKYSQTQQQNTVAANAFENERQENVSDKDIDDLTKDFSHFSRAHVNEDSINRLSDTTAQKSATSDNVPVTSDNSDDSVINNVDVEQCSFDSICHTDNILFEVESRTLNIVRDVEFLLQTNGVNVPLLAKLTHEE